jgi:hypothetical protein
VSRIAPTTFTAKSGEPILLRTTAADATRLVALRAAILEERLYMMAEPGEGVFSADKELE